MDFDGKLAADSASKSDFRSASHSYISPSELRRGKKNKHQVTSLTHNPHQTDETRISPICVQTARKGPVNPYNPQVTF